MEMTLHYFQLEKLEPEQDTRLRAIFGEATVQPRRAWGRRPQFTPAMVEQMASEHESIDNFISALEAREVLERMTQKGAE